jgi:hypothetical protein
MPISHTILGGPMVKMFACHAGDPGSIPGSRALLFTFLAGQSWTSGLVSDAQYRLWLAS